jgi:hypothetical protein
LLPLRIITKERHYKLQQSGQCSTLVEVDEKKKTENIRAGDKIFILTFSVPETTQECL